jgi:2-C-methyl-D-erythritol 4-phosphate cytidylyltransferase
MDKSVIITAGGIGKRMGHSIPKQFIELNRLPILMHTVNCFYNYDPAIQIIIVLPKEQLENWSKLIIKHKFEVHHSVTHGGSERFHSIKNGLKIVKSDFVAIHDAVRPFVRHEVITNLFNTVELKQNAIPVIDIKESIRFVNNNESKALNRVDYKIVQTPQVFNTQLIKKAYQQDYSINFTDDASVLESIGEKINVVDGNEENIKITTPLDLILAEEIIKSFS